MIEMIDPADSSAEMMLRQPITVSLVKGTGVPHLTPSTSYLVLGPPLIGDSPDICTSKSIIFKITF